MSLAVCLLIDDPADAAIRELWRRLETRYNIRIRGVQPALSVSAQAAEYGDALWMHDPDRCCELRKMAPLQGELAAGRIRHHEQVRGRIRARLFGARQGRACN